jgi:hypothetical protein
MDPGKLPIPPDRRDDIGTPGVDAPGVSLPADLSRLPDEIDQRIETETEQQLIAVGDTYNALDREVSGIESAMRLAVSSVVGSLDNEIRTQEDLTDKPIDKITKDALVAAFTSEYEMKANGVAIPAEVDHILNSLNDETGDGTLSQLMGIDPSPKPAALDAALAGAVAGADAAQVAAPSLSVNCFQATDPADGQLKWYAYDATTGGTRLAVAGDGCFADGTEPPATFIPNYDPTKYQPPEPTPVPPVPPSPPPPACPPTTDCGCSKPVNVTVTIPPITYPPCPYPTPVPPTVPPYTPPKPPVSPVPPVPPTPVPPVPPTPSPPVPPGTIDATGGTVPPTPAPKEYPTGPSVLYPPVAWEREGACKQASDLALRVGMDYFNRYIAGGAPVGGSPLRDFALVNFGSGVKWLREFGEGLGVPGGAADEERLGAEIVDASARAAGIDAFLESPVVSLNSNAPQLRAVGYSIALAEKVETDSHFPASYLAQSAKYTFQYLSPQYIPTQSEVNALFLADQITSDHWDCWTRANGNIPAAFVPILKASRTRPNVAQTVSLYLRGEIPADDMQRRLRELGVVEQADRDAFERLMVAIPNQTDLVSWMVRDAFDDKVAEKYDYDKDFDKKFTGKAKAWAEAQGIDASQFKYTWRSHWKIPSPTQLYEMLHRFRPDRAEVVEWDRRKKDLFDREGRDPDTRRPLVVTLDDVRQALEIDDHAPAWISALIGISYHPITRTDAIAAFHSGAFDSTQLYSSFRDNGADHDTAELSVAIQEAVRGRRLANLSGVWTTRQVVAGFKDGTLTRAKADTLLAPIVVDPRQRQSILDGADEQAATETMRVEMKKIRRGFFVGEYEKVAVVGMLKKIGVADGRVNDILTRWDADRTGRYREPTTRMIIQWCALNIITLDDAYRRVLMLGYNDIDARRIVYQGADAYRTKTLGQIDKEEAKVRRIIKDAKQAKKEQQAELEKRQKAIQAEVEKLEKERERIQKELDDRRPQ